ncbi:MAG TPA: hypothetical protein P5137_12600, partial [Candidatus Brocadiia bacterium]|nr:hypothetical protein [Candidatus Brocadiia bacterium]
GDQLTLRVSKPGLGLTVRGDALPELPATARRILSDAAQTGYDLMRDDTVVTARAPWVLQGSAILKVRIKADVEP